MTEQNIITMFGSSQPQPETPDYKAAYEVGHALAKAGYTIASGGYRGVMAAASQGAKDAGGATIGITTAHFDSRGLAANEWVDTELKQPDYQARLLKLVEMADGFVIMRGGSGTLNELFHVWEMMKNGSIPVRPIVLYGDCWPRIIGCLGAELADEAAFSRHLDLLTFVGSPAEVVNVFNSD